MPVESGQKVPGQGRASGCGPRGLGACWERSSGSPPIGRALIAPENLMSEGEVTLTSLRLDVVEQDGLSEARALREAHVPGYDRLEDEVLEVAADVARHLVGDVRPRVEH